MIRKLLLRTAAVLALCAPSTNARAEGVDIRDVALSPAYGFFNGYLNQINVIECSNQHSASALIEGQIYDWNGSARETFQLAVPAGATRHLILNQFDISNRYGSFKLSLSGASASYADRLKCFTAYYRIGTDSVRAVEFAHMLPLRRLSTGSVFGVANSNNPDGAGFPTQNWVSVFNGGDVAASYTVIVYDLNGQELRRERIESLPAKGRKDLALGHNDVDLGGQTINSYQILPDSLTNAYSAFNTRYGTTGAGFHFAFAAFAEEGDCRNRPLFVSTIGESPSYVELLNTGATTKTFDVIIRNQSGQIRSSQSLSLAAKAQRHLPLLARLSPDLAGTVEVTCRDEDDSSVIRNLVTYGKRDGVTAWAYLTPSREPSAEAGTSVVFPLNTNLAAYNWLKVFEGGSSTTTFSQSIRDESGTDLSTTDKQLAAHSQAAYPLHETLPQERVGSLLLTPKVTSARSFAEVLRVFPAADGSPGYVMHVPSSILAKPATSATFSQVASGFVQPVTVAFSPDDTGRMFVSTKLGLVHVVVNGATLGTPFIDLTATTNTAVERGLSNIAFHPQFTNNGKVYVARTDQTFASVVEEYRVSNSDPNRLDPSTRRLVLSVPRNGDFHISGTMFFAPDGTLFVSQGDDGPQGDPFNNAQNPALLLGKLLRINVDQGATYTVPSDNPFVGSNTFRPEIWAYGLRNPYSYSIDPRTSRMFLADVGYNDREEINIIEPGKNYGWNIYEGTLCTNLGGTCSTTGLTPPIFDYGHDVGISVLGGGVYRGSAHPALYGKYIYIDYGSKKLYTLEEIADGSWRNAEIATLSQAGLPTAINADTAGELYITDIYGKVFKLTGSS